MVSPYDLNPQGLNPLAAILADVIDFDALARGAEGHLLRDDALARVVHLRRRRVAARLAGADPARPELGQAVAGVDALGARGVVDVEVAVGLVLEVDAAERDLFFFFF